MKTAVRANIRSLIVLAGIVLILSYSMKGAAMAFFSGTDVVLFSPMEGKLTYQGQPAANAKIVRHIIWKDAAGEKDTFYANEKGEFSLPIKRDLVRIPALGEFVISQEISVFYEGKKFDIWGISKRDLEEYGELGGKLTNFRCELTDKLVYPSIPQGLFGTSCKWDSIIKQGN